MTSAIQLEFNHKYQLLLRHLKLKGLRPKTIDAYSRAIRRMGDYFDYHLDDLSELQLLNYFHQLLGTHSWTTVKLDLYGLKFYYAHVLHKPWVMVDLVKPPKGQYLPDIVTVEEASHLFMSTKVLSYRVLFFTLYSLGLRLGEGVRLEVGDIDSARHCVHIRHAKGNKDRLVPLPDTTLELLKHYWRVHQHPTLLFPNRKRGLSMACQATSPLDMGGVQLAMRRVVENCGIKKDHPA